MIFPSGSDRGKRFTIDFVTGRGKRSGMTFFEQPELRKMTLVESWMRLLFGPIKIPPAVEAAPKKRNRTVQRWAYDETACGHRHQGSAVGGACDVTVHASI